MACDSEEELEALTQFMYLAPVGLVQTGRDGAIMMINPLSAQLLMPLSPDGSLDNLYSALEGIAPDLRHRVDDFAGERGMVCDAMHLRLDAGAQAEPRTLSLTLLKLDADRLMAVLSDVTESVRRERMLKQSQAWFNAILTGITDYAVISLDAQGRVDDWNPSIGRVTGFPRETVIDRPYSVFYPEESMTDERISDRLHEADRDGWSIDDGWRRRADGTRFWGSAIIAPLSGPAGDDEVPPAGAARGYRLIIRDITDKRKASEALRKAIACDHLTGLANRRAFFETAELEVGRWKRQPRALSLIMIDVDHFKAVNDTYGHPAGDAVLRGLAATLAATFREVDLVARIGGEEFVVLLPSAELAGAAAVADRVRRKIEAQVIDAAGVPLRCTVSAGVATMSADVADLAGLMKRADQALYAAKGSGRNRVECWSASVSADCEPATA